MESKLLKKVENAILNDEYGITKINVVDWLLEEK